MSVYRPKYRDRKGKLKESQVWWFHFTFAGRHIQESSKSTRKTLAMEAEKNRRLELERASVGLPSQPAGERVRRLSDVLDDYTQAYAVNHRKKSIATVKERLAHVRRLLGNLLLSDITATRIVEYMETRLSELTRFKHAPSGRTINLEIQKLAEAIGYTWKTLWPRVKKLPENHDVGQALTPDQEVAVLEAAARNRSPLIYPFLFTLAWTGLRSDEARTLQWWQVSFAGTGEIIVGDSKTEAGKGRHIPMTANLKAVLDQHQVWYTSKLGKLDPDWYIFPLCNRIKPVDPTRPITSFKTAWNTVRKVAKVDCRLHDLRHSFCTKMGEAGASERAMLDMMGHMSAAMLQRYSHFRAQARREAMDAVEARHNSNQAAKESAKDAKSESKKQSVTH